MNREKLKIMSVVGARPNLMKLAPLAWELARHADRIEHIIVHTGQHYDQSMSKTFFEALDIPKPDIDLGIGSGSHAEQVGRTMIAFEKVVKERKPDWIIVVGDVNATCACSVTAKKELVQLAHIEAGLRAFDLTMPEEINRMVTDRLSDVLFTPDAIADANLLAEGAAVGRIKRVGNIMIDTLERHRGKAASLRVRDVVTSGLLGQGRDAGLPVFRDDAFAVITLHRPSNVDDPRILAPLLDFFVNELAPELAVIWPLHPRTFKEMERFGLMPKANACHNLFLVTPLGYHEMLRLNMGAKLMLTDSGGLQEECCVLGTPCLTLRWNTERPVTLAEHGGASMLVGNDVNRIRDAYRKAKGLKRTPYRPPLWDGHTAERIAAFFCGLAPQ